MTPLVTAVWLALWLLLISLVDVSVQQCTTETFAMNVPGIIETTQNVQKSQSVA